MTRVWITTDTSNPVLPEAVRVVNDLPYDARRSGIVADGVTNDLAAMTQAVLNAGDQILELPAGTILMHETAGLAFFLDLAASGLTIRGQGSDKTTLLLTANSSAFRIGFSMSPNITIENLTIRRGYDYQSVMFQFHDGDNDVTFRNCVIEGGNVTYGTNYTHGASMPETGVVKSFHIEGCTFNQVDWSLLMSNTSTATISDLRVLNSTFLAWGGEGLGLNAPVGTNIGARISGCRFSHPTANPYSALSFAHVTDFAVSGCDFDTCGGEAIHIEDYSTGVVSGCTFRECSTVAGFGVIQIIDSAEIVITGNTITNTTALSAIATNACISIQGSTSGTTVGGRARAGATHDITVSGNTIDAGPNAAIYTIHTARYSVTDNTLNGGLAISTGFVESGTNVYSGVKAQGNLLVGATVVGNRIKGFRHGVGYTSFSNASFQPGTVIAQNLISQCRYGINGNNTKPATYNGNIIQQCIHPMVIAATGFGGAGGGNDPYTITGNNFNGCQRRASINGVLIVVAAGGATVGSGVTLTVEALLADVPNGKVIPFSGGGTLTLTAGAVSTATSLVGNLTVANIVSGETGVVPSLVDRPYITPFNANNRAVGLNCDSVAGTYA